MAVDPTARGFTLIELMIALAIGSLLMILGVPSFTDFLRNSEIRSVTESLVNGLRLARTEATNRNLQVRFTLLGAGATWTGWTVDQVNPAVNIQAYSKAEGGTHTAVASTISTATSITFNGLGRICPNPDPDNVCVPVVATDNLQQLNISSTSGGTRPLRILLPNVVNTATQGIRVCDPNMPVMVPPDARAC